MIYSRCYHLVDDSGKEYQPPTMYDVNTDTVRPVTQKDVERWENIARAYGKLIAVVKEQRADDDRGIDLS